MAQLQIVILGAEYGLTLLVVHLTVAVDVMKRILDVVFYGYKIVQVSVKIKKSE